MSNFDSYIDYKWNLDGPLKYISPFDLIEWVNQSEYKYLADEIFLTIESFNQRDQIITNRQHRYLDIKINNIVVRASVSKYDGSLNPYVELYHSNNLIVTINLIGNSYYGLIYNKKIKFISQCIVYASVMLIDNTLINDETADQTDSNYIISIEGDTIMKTKAFSDTFKGHKMFAVWKVDSDGEKVGEYPVVSVGLKKAEAIINHLDDLKNFVDENKDSSVSKYNTSKLDDDDKKKLALLLVKMS